MSAVMAVEPCELHEVSNCHFCKPRVRCAGSTRTLVTAKHNSVCPGCGSRIAAGDSRTEGGPGKWLCMTCALVGDAVPGKG